MPQQAQGSLTSTLDDPEFRKLSPDAQKIVLGKYGVSDEMQGKLMAHLGTQAATPASAMPEPPGFFSRLAGGLGLPQSMDELKAMAPSSAADAIVGPALTAGKAVTGYAKQVGKGLKEGAQDVSEAHQDLLSGGPVLANLGKAGYGIAHAALQAIPGAGPATETAGQDVATGNYTGAAGGMLAATLQAMMLRGGKGASSESRINKLTYASGESGGTASALRHVLPDIDETVAKNGRPKTVGEFQKAVRDTSSRLDQQFNSALFRNAHKTLVPDEIANALEAKAGEMPPSADGQAMAAKLKDAATEYRKPWTLRQLNQERILRNGYTRGFYGKEGSAQMAAMRSSADTIIDKTVADGTRDVLYQELQRANPKADFRALKMKQSHMIELQDQLDKHLGKLEDAQAAQKGQPLTEKATMTASAHAGGVTPRMHGLMKLIPGRGPLSSADSTVTKAFPRSKVISPTRAAILALPVTALTRTGQGMPQPPSETSDQQQPQQ